MKQAVCLASSFRANALLCCCAVALLSACGGSGAGKDSGGLQTQTAAELIDSKTVSAEPTVPVAGAAAADEPDVNAPAVPVEAEAQQGAAQAAPLAEAKLEVASPPEQPVATRAAASAAGTRDEGTIRVYVASGPAPSAP